MIESINGNIFTDSKGRQRFLYELAVRDLEQLDTDELLHFVENNKRSTNSIRTSYLYKMYFLKGRIFLDSPSEDHDFKYLNASPYLESMTAFINGRNFYSDAVFKSDYCKLNGEYIRFIGLSFSENHSLDIAGLQKYGEYLLMFERVKTLFSKNMVNDARKMSHTTLYSALADIEGIEVYKENEEMLRAIITREKELFKTEVLFIVRADSELQLKSKTDKLVESLETEGFAPKITTKSLNNDLNNYFFGTTPRPQRSLLFDTSMLTNCFPVHKDMLMKSGVEFDSRGGESLNIDTCVGDSYSSVITGRTGNGKTVFTNKMISEELRKNRKVFIIDPKRDYRKHAYLENAYVIDQFINPMMFKNDESLLNLIMSKIPVTAEVELLAGKILKYIRKHDLHKYSDFFEVLEKLEEEGLEDISCYFEDVRKNITSVDNEIHNFTYVEMSNFSTKALPFILSFAFEYVALLKDSYSLIVDEAHRVFKHNPVFLEERAREMRSKNASLITITQSFNDLISNEFGQIVADSSYHKFFFAQGIKPSSTITPFDCERISTLHTVKGEYSEFYYKSEVHKKILRYYPTATELEVYGSELQQTDNMLQYIKDKRKYFSVEECVNQWVRDKYA